MELKALIFKRKKVWYIQYTVFINNEEITKQLSTKVKVTEKSIKWMKEHYLPAWIARKKEEFAVSKKPLVSRERSFKAYAVMFLEQYEKNHDYQNVNYRTKRIVADFGSRNIDEITKLEIKQWINSLSHAQIENKPITHNSKSKYLRIFRGIFELAVDNEVLEKNYCYDIRLQKQGSEQIDEDIKPFNSNEITLLLEASKNPIYGEYLHLYLGVAFNEGMSPAEILALQVGDVDFKQKTISITKNLTKGKIKEPKTKYRKRTIPMFRSAEPYFKELLERARDKKSLWLFSKDDGMHLEDIKDLRGDREIIKDNRRLKHNTKWYKLLNDLAIEYRDLKNCRHTFAVKALESKAFTMQQVANILGHGSLQMLLKHYAKYIGDVALDIDRDVSFITDTFTDTLEFKKEGKA
jgi:integrase